MRIEIINFSKLDLDIKIFSLLFAFLPIALITGPALPDIILTLISIYFLIISIKKKLFDYYKNYFVIFFFIFCIYSILRSLLSISPIESLLDEGTIFYFRYIFFVLGLKYLYEKNIDLIKYFLIIFLFCLILMFFYGFYEFFVGKDIFGNKILDNSRITSFMYDNEAVMGRYVSFFSSIVLAFLIYTVKLRNYIFLLITFLIITLSTILISGDRIPLLKYSIFIISFIFFLPKFRKEYFISITIIILISTLAIYNSVIIRDRIIDMTYNQILSDKIIPFTPYSNVYESIYISSIKMGEKNVLFGNGPKLYKSICLNNPEVYPNEACHTHSHNFYLQLWAELGLIGLFFILLFYLSLILTLIKNILSLNRNIINKEVFYKENVFIIMLLIFVLPLLPNMSFYNNWNNVFLFTIISLLFCFNNKLFIIVKNKY